MPDDPTAHRSEAGVRAAMDGMLGKVRNVPAFQIPRIRTSAVACYLAACCSTCNLYIITQSDSLCLNNQRGLQFCNISGW